MICIAGLGYSLHISNDKNKKNSVKKSAKTNLSGTTSKGNNAIQNSAGLSNLESENISLNKKLKEQEITIADLKNENKSLSSKLKYFKDMFYSLVQFLMDKIFRIKDNKYKELYNHGALAKENY